MKFSKSKIVVIGGGNGTAAILSGLKNYSHNLTAVVNMADDGGSTGRLRRELGALPPGDIRMCLEALANNKELKELFKYRFENGGLAGHSFGNLFLSAAEKKSGDFLEAIGIASSLLSLDGRVVPSTTENVRLVLEESNRSIIGEYQLANTPLEPLKNEVKLRLEPSGKILPEARDAIIEADCVLIGPGNLYCSITPILLVEGISEALHNTKAKVIFVCGLINLPHQTRGFTVGDYAREIERFSGQVLDYVIHNTQKVSDGLRPGEELVEYDSSKCDSRYKVIGENLIDDKLSRIDPNDDISHLRSSLTHNGAAIAGVIEKLMSGEG